MGLISGCYQIEGETSVCLAGRPAAVSIEELVALWSSVVGFAQLKATFVIFGIREVLAKKGKTHCG